MPPEIPTVRVGKAANELGSKVGLLPRQKIKTMIARHMIRVTGIADLDSGQIQPASLDLRLGPNAFRVRASFLPGKDSTVAQQLAELKYDELDISGGGVLEKGCVYVVPLMEELNLPDSIVGLANPKSSTGRLDVFTRLICNNNDVFDNVQQGYEGPLYAEISPRSFSIRVKQGSRLNQIRFRKLNSQQFDMPVRKVSDKDLRKRHDTDKLADGEAEIRNGLLLRIDLAGEGDGSPIGYRAQKFTDIIDIDRPGHYDPNEYWDPIMPNRRRRIILDPHQFYILASRERIHIPPDLAAEMVPIDPTMGEFRVHYAGFFDPGFGYTEHGHPGSKAVLEVRSHEVPFVLEDGQVVGRLEYEKLAEKPDVLYGQGGVSNYQGQGLKLSKHFSTGT